MSEKNSAQSTASQDNPQCVMAQNTAKSRFALLKRTLKATLALFALIAALGGATWLEMDGFFMKDLNGTAERIARSANFKDRVVQNVEPTPMMTNANSSEVRAKIAAASGENSRPQSQISSENSAPQGNLREKGENLDENLTGNQSTFSVILSLLSSPKVRIPSVKSNLAQMPEASFVWFGHSSYLIKLGSKHILIDPILRDNAAPVPFIIEAFDEADIYEPQDLPNIDFLVITHNHYDHLSKKTIKKLAPKVRQAIVPLGVGKYLAAWGIDESAITELDWDESAEFTGFTFHALTARHFSGRGLLDQNKSLWVAFMLEFEGRRLFLGGDSGYGVHFKGFGERFGGADIAFLENGQFNAQWAAIHAFPHESLQIAQDLCARRIVSVHNAKFRLATHAWDAPLERLFTLYSQGNFNFELLMPQIGQITPLWGEKFELKPWWREANSQ